jgi:hypothetical protein
MCDIPACSQRLVLATVAGVGGTDTPTLMKLSSAIMKLVAEVQGFVVSFYKNQSSNLVLWPQ